MRDALRPRTILVIGAALLMSLPIGAAVPSGSATTGRAGGPDPVEKIIDGRGAVPRRLDIPVGVRVASADLRWTVGENPWCQADTPVMNIGDTTVAPDGHDADAAWSDVTETLAGLTGDPVEIHGVPAAPSCVDSWTLRVVWLPWLPEAAVSVRSEIRPATVRPGSRVEHIAYITNTGKAVVPVLAADFDLAPCRHVLYWIPPGETDTVSCAATADASDQTARVDVHGTSLYGQRVSATSTEPMQVIRPGVDLVPTSAPAVTVEGEPVEHEVLVRNVGNARLSRLTLAAANARCHAPPALDAGDEVRALYDGGGRRDAGHRSQGHRTGSARWRRHGRRNAADAGGTGRHDPARRGGELATRYRR